MALEPVLVIGMSTSDRLEQAPSGSDMESSLGERDEILGLAANRVQPPPEVRQRLMDYVRAEAQPAPGITVHRAADGWQPHPVPNTRWKMVATDEQTGAVTMLLKLDAESRFPAHEHKGAEQCLVIEGSFFIGERFYVAGDFIYASPGTADDEIYTREGTTVLLIVSAADAAASY